MKNLQKYLQLKQPEGKEATRLRTWLIFVESLLILISIGFIVFWLYLDQRDFVVPSVFSPLLTPVAYGIGIYLAWRGKLWQSALLVSGWHILAAFDVFWAMPVGGNLVVSLFVLNLIFASIFLNGRFVSIFAVISFLLFTLLTFVKFNNNSGLPQLAFVFPYLLSVAIFVLSYALLMLNLKVNQRTAAAAMAAETRYRLLFDASPISLWEEDATEVMARIEELRQEGIEDFRAYFEENPAVVVELMDLMKVLNVNETAVSMYNAQDKMDLIKGDLSRFLPEESYSFVLDSLMALVNRDRFFEEEIANITLAGEMLTVLFCWAIPPGQDGANTPMIVSMVDVTARKQVEEVLKKYSDRQRSLHELDLAINVKQSPEEISEEALNFVMQFVPASGAEVWSYAADGHTVSLLAVSFADRDGERRLQDPIQPAAHMLSEEMQDDMRNNQVYVVDDLWGLRYLPPALMALKKSGARSFVQMPLMVRGKPVGFLNIFDKGIDTYTPEYIGIVREIAAPLSIALGNIQLYVAENIARNQAETMRRVAAQINASLELKPLLEQILEYLEIVIPFDSATIFLEKEGILKIEAQRGLPIDIDFGIIEAIGNKLGASLVFTNGEPCIIPDTRRDPSWRVLTGLEYIRCWMGVPLQVKGRTIGVLTLDKSVAQFYTESNQEIAVAFANQAAVAIENARLYEQMRQYADDLEVRVEERMRDLSTLYEITAVANKHLNLDKILDESLSILLKTLNAYTGAIYILDGESKFCIKSQVGAPDILKPVISASDSDDGLLQHIIDVSAPLIVRDLAISPMLASLTEPIGYLTYAGVALRVQDDVVGLLSVINQENKPFSMEDIALLASVADHFGVIVENGRLRQQNQAVAVLKERERLARELHDSVSQSLYSLTLFAEASRDMLRTGNGNKLLEYLDDISATAQQALKEMRLMLYELRSSTLGEEGLVNALRYRLEAVEGRSGIDANIEAQLDIEIPPKLRRTLYLIAQEALNNTLKHAKATEVFVTLNRQGRKLIMTIEDNGQGFSNQSTNAGGLGMAIMRERIESINGNFLVHSLPGVGTKIEVSVDLAKYNGVA